MKENARRTFRFPLLTCVQLFAAPWTAARQSSLSITNSRSLLKHVHWVSDAILPCHPMLSSCLQSVPASGFFPMSRLFSVSGGQSIGALASVLPMNIQGWFPLGLIGLISLLSKGLARAFSSTPIWKHQFFSAQPSLWSNSHICIWLLEKPWLWQLFPSLKGRLSWMGLT